MKLVFHFSNLNSEDRNKLYMRDLELNAYFAFSSIFDENHLNRLYSH